MKYVPVYGEIDSIPANNTGIIAEFEVPAGKYAEVYAVGVIPDYDPTTGDSFLDYVSFAHSTVKGEIGSTITRCRLSANYYRNAVPYGNGASKQPEFLIDIPATTGNMTYKFAAGDVIQLVGKALSTATGKVRARFEVILLEPEEVSAIYGVTSPDEWINLPGGYSQKNLLPLYDFFTNQSPTSGTGKWEKFAEVSVQDYEYIHIRELGFAPNDNSVWFRIYDESGNKYFPSLTNYPFRVTKTENELPFGSDKDYQPRRPAPVDLASHLFNNTKIDFEIQDNGNSIPENGICLQIVGSYRVEKR